MVYYALGGGLGHLTRARAIIPALVGMAPAQFHISFISNSPHTEKIVDNVDQLAVVSSQAELEPALDRMFETMPDLFVVDTFPRGLMGELVKWLDRLSCPRILIQRYLNERYVRDYSIADFVGRHYDCALRLADNLPQQNFCTTTIDLPPITILDQIGSCKPVPKLFDEEERGLRLLFVDFGSAADAYLEAIPPSFAVRVITLDPVRLTALGNALSYYPAAALFDQADLIVGACGYNLYHEVKRSGRQAIFLPQPRTYDDQFGRSRSTASATTVEEFIKLLSNW
jgi:hypothetical protein